MSAIGEAVGGIAGGIAGMASTQGDKERAEAQYDRAKGRQIYNTEAAGVQGNAFDKVDPVSRNAMLQALADYQNKANQGGLDAKGRANLEAGQARAAQTAAQTAAQIQAQSAARGRAQGPGTMIAQQVAAQQGAELARANGLQSGAIAEDARNQALAGSMQAAGGVYGMDANKAAAMNAINAFNVQNAQQNIHNKAHQADALSGLDTREAGMYEGRAQRDYDEFSGQGKELGGAVGGLAGGLMGGGGISSAASLANLPGIKDGSGGHTGSAGYRNDGSGG